MNIGKVLCRWMLHITQPIRRNTGCFPGTCGARLRCCTFLSRRINQVQAAVAGARPCAGGLKYGSATYVRQLQTLFIKSTLIPTSLVPTEALVWIWNAMSSTEVAEVEAMNPTEAAWCRIGWISCVGASGEMETIALSVVGTGESTYRGEAAPIPPSALSAARYLLRGRYIETYVGRHLPFVLWPRKICWVAYVSAPRTYHGRSLASLPLEIHHHHNQHHHRQTESRIQSRSISILESCFHPRSDSSSCFDCK
ncbi:hypothetical protein LY78DRAFT_398490 [Colletotrichum sublineola]|nr:hypothetical protein LY78DRAFT_398490 [Colletotrichum sublineola]